MKTKGVIFGIHGFLFLLRFNDSLFLIELNLFVRFNDIWDVAMNLSIAVTFLEYDNVIHIVSIWKSLLKSFIKIWEVLFNSES